MSEIEERFLSAQRYFRALVDIQPGTQWRKAVQTALKEKHPGPESFALLHPQYFNFEETTRVKVQGRRAFPSDAMAGLRGYGCLSVRVWGYACDLSFAVEMNADHLFPYSLGGSTASSNVLPLCAYHNQVKTHDVHLYPHWNSPPEWVWRGLRKRLVANS